MNDHAEDAGQDKGVVEAALFDVGLAQDGHWRGGSGFKVAFHGGQRGSLMAGDKSTLLVTGGEGDQ